MTKTKKYLVDDYMKKQFRTIRDNATFKEAVAAMMENKSNGLIVVDDTQKVVGMLSTLDLIAYIVPDYLEEDKHLAAFEAEDVFAKRTHAVAHHKINLFMTKRFHALKAHHSLMEASTLMSEFNIRHLPVLDEKGVAVGYLTRTDVKMAIADILDL